MTYSRLSKIAFQLTEQYLNDAFAVKFHLLYRRSPNPRAFRGAPRYIWRNIGKVSRANSRRLMSITYSRSPERRANLTRRAAAFPSTRFVLRTSVLYDARAMYDIVCSFRRACSPGDAFLKHRDRDIGITRGVNYDEGRI